MSNAARPPPRVGEKTLSDFADGGCLKVEMQETSDAQLLRDYAADGNEAAFRDIVARHTDLIYSAALRQVGSPDRARDVAQSVFIEPLMRVTSDSTCSLPP
jgi:hypothetical protein